MLLTETLDTRRWLNDTELRRHIDRSISRALVDRDFEGQLLSDPTVALSDQGCSPQQFISLRGVRARDLTDFARQVLALFWRVDADPWAFEDAPLAASGGG